MPLTETYMALELLSNWAEETEQKIFEKSRGWKKIAKKSFHLWESVSPQKKNMKLILVTSAKHAIENNLDPQREVKNETKLFVLLVEKGYQKNTIGLM
ncbi:hypothetical protein G9A89_009108 [Geosiphon pyriformis]|nr:hypothetical protein G9A89_009108 [Geosiphon pyriformis]